MPPDHEQEQLNKLLAIIHTALQQDEQLRQKYQIGEKFRFIRERLQSLLTEIQQQPVTKKTQKKHSEGVSVEEDELLLYVYLYNAQGNSFRTWQNIVTSKAFLDYSVNRPIYQERIHIEAFIRSKTVLAHHGYLTFAVKKERVLSNNSKDAMGHSLVKVKEGSLKIEKLLSFTHNEQTYILSENGELIKKL